MSDQRLRQQISINKRRYIAELKTLALVINSEIKHTNDGVYTLVGDIDTVLLRVITYRNRLVALLELDND